MGFEANILTGGAFDQNMKRFIMSASPPQATSMARHDAAGKRRDDARSFDVWRSLWGGDGILARDQWVEAAGVSLRCRLEGRRDGPLLVLAHEMGGSLDAWDGVVAHLADDFRLLRYDMRGCGRSQKIVADTSFRELSGDLDALLDALGIDAPVICAGIAVGGAAMADFAAYRPQRVRGLCLFSPAFGVDPAVRAERLADAERIRASGMRAIADRALETGYPAKYREGREDDFRRFRGLWLGNDATSFVAFYRMLALADFAPVLAAIACPVLCVGCTDDPLRPPERIAHEASQISAARFTTIESGHHSPQLTPRAVAATIAAFADGLMAEVVAVG